MIKYEIGVPTKMGVYACRVHHNWFPGLLKDVFLMWYTDKKWHYLSSDQRYRGEVLGWIGPLPRKL